MRLVFALALAIACCFVPLQAKDRVIVPLDGEWKIGESLEAGKVPSAFDHTVRVPGLINQAKPAFPMVDEFQSRELIDKMVREKTLPSNARTKEVGFSKQPRNYFWYQRTFRTPEKRTTAILKINKAQFGVQVWLNGKNLGDHLNCFAAGYFDLTPAINWTGDNTLIVRVGAHPAVLPKDVPAGTDFEKLKWAPGIYDSVSVHLMDDPVISTVQVAPRIKEGKILVQTVVKSYGKGGAFPLAHKVIEWKSGKLAATSKPSKVTLQAGESKTVDVEIPIPNARLWSPEDPFLYVLETATPGDSLKTRFGYRDIRFDTATKRAMLNGKVYFLRGSNVTLHRFFEDPLAGSLPWDEKWVRALLIDIPKKMNWNSFRFCIGPVPDMWMDIADEAGLLLQNEFFVWTGGEGWNSWHDDWTPETFVKQYSEWMRDNWNHPSQAIWDASNETAGDMIKEKVIPVVRKLDLSDRAWDNGYTDPTGPNDPIEDHPYEHIGIFNKSGSAFRMEDLEKGVGAKTGHNSAHPSGHPVIVNEYGWLWLNRDGSPTELTKKVYEAIAPNSTPAERIELNNYLLGGLTEYWRAHRNFAGVLHFVYLTCSYPGVYTSDHFKDIEKLELHPSFADYVGESFKPLGVYVNFWQAQMKPGEKKRIAVSVINDEHSAREGELVAAFARAGSAPQSAGKTAFHVDPLGQQTFRMELAFPTEPGHYVLSVTASYAGKTTVSRRKLIIK
jgi:hypothetical protein